MPKRSRSREIDWEELEKRLKKAQAYVDSRKEELPHLDYDGLQLVQRKADEIFGQPLDMDGLTNGLFSQLEAKAQERREEENKEIERALFHSANPAPNILTFDPDWDNVLPEPEEEEEEEEKEEIQPMAGEFDQTMQVVRQAKDYLSTNSHPPIEKALATLEKNLKNTLERESELADMVLTKVKKKKDGTTEKATGKHIARAKLSIETARGLVNKKMHEITDLLSRTASIPYKARQAVRPPQTRWKRHRLESEKKELEDYIAEEEKRLKVLERWLAEATDSKNPRLPEFFRLQPTPLIPTSSSSSSSSSSYHPPTPVQVNNASWAESLGLEY